MLKVHLLNYQRNGISGEGFHVVHFDWNEPDEQCKNMVATVFDEKGYCGVICLDDLTKCWRGDHFEDALRKHIEDFK